MRVGSAGRQCNKRQQHLLIAQSKSFAFLLPVRLLQSNYKCASMHALALFYSARYSFPQQQLCMHGGTAAAGNRLAAASAAARQYNNHHCSRSAACVGYRVLKQARQRLACCLAVDYVNFDDWLSPCRQVIAAEEK
jgi:hypothetical protein